MTAYHQGWWFTGQPLPGIFVNLSSGISSLVTIGKWIQLQQVIQSASHRPYLCC